MEPFSQLLGLLRLRAEIYHNYRVCGDWSIPADDTGHSCFHMATQGNCRMLIPGEEDIVLETGDLVIFSREISHQLRPVDQMEGEQQHLPYAAAQDKPGTSLLCGRVEFEHRGHGQLLDALPQVFIIRRQDSDPWLSPLLQLILDESLLDQSGANVILNRLSELLFTYALRHFTRHSGRQAGLLGVYADPLLHRALIAMHQQLAYPWTLVELAEKAAMSRTVFAERFKQASGLTPMQYLAWWRMQNAWALLTEGQPVAEVADAVGYRSEAAFFRAFKREFGVAPGVVRRQKA